MKIKKLITISLICFMLCGMTINTEVYAAQTVRTKFVDADLQFSISGYVPSITGTVYCTEGKTIIIRITNLSDSTIIADETITDEQGTCNLSYVLPSLLSPKEYAVTINCIENDVSLADISVTIDSSIILVSVDGAINIANDVELDASVQSTNTGLIDINNTYVGYEDVSTTIPNLASNASFHLTAQGYELSTQPDIPSPPILGEATISASVQNSSKNVSVTGNISTGASQQVTLLVNAPNDDIAYIDQVTSGISGTFTINFKLPEGAVNGVYHVKVGGTDVNTPIELDFTYTDSDVPDPIPDPEPDSVIKSYTVSENTNVEFRVVVDSNNIQSFEDRIFAIDYDENIVAPTSLYGMRCQNTLQTGIYDNVNVLSQSDGKIKFKMENIIIPPDKEWSGIMNIFKFKFLSETGGTTEIKLLEE